MIKNASTLPEIYYGLHMVEGPAEYSDPGKEPYKILVGETCIKNMNPTFAGKPVYVDHVDEVDLENLQKEADGYVVESFYNKADGKNWVKFIVVSDRGKEAIRMGWKLSNAYVPTSFAGGGLYHGIEYEKEVMGGEYEHLAIVRHPRYEESQILTPDEFKVYNGKKELELERLTNSKEKQKEKKMAFNLFTRKKLENSIDIESTMVELPKSKKEMTIASVLNAYDAILNMHGYANGDHMVKVGENEMSVNELVKKHMEMCNKMDEEKEENDGEGEPGEDVEMDNDVEEDDTVEEGEKDVGSRGGDRHENEEDEEEEDLKKDKKSNEAAKLLARKKALAVKNAKPRYEEEERATVDLSMDQIARGKQRYGSGV